jgi:hypothetical protein
MRVQGWESLLYTHILEARSKALGFASVSELAANYLPEIPVKTAQRGDIMLHPMQMLGICDGAHSYFVTQTGVTRIPFTMCLKAWRV